MGVMVRMDRVLTDNNQTPKIQITIDGQKLLAPQGSMIIEAADEAKIHIPRFCYHNKLSVAANCRMCLVDIEGGRKPMAACATPISEGMIVETKNEKAISYQKSVMEFLLINHPLDCPICDQGGECELQDLSMGYGQGETEYTETKRSVTDHDLGSLIATDLTRCIQCTRCVRFGEEIAGKRELGLTCRGEFAKIETFLNSQVNSEVSGNVIDICPVGALTSKPFRFKARSWEMSQHAFVSPHDCLGSNLYAHVKGNKLNNNLLRVVPKQDEDINEIWISDRDRFSYESLKSADRLASPMIKLVGELENADWDQALSASVSLLQKHLSKKGSDSLCALTTSQITLEEGFLLQKLARGLGSNNIDFRQHTSANLDDSSFYGINCKFSELDNSDCVFVFGCDMRSQVPALHLRLRKAWYQNEADICILNPADFDYRMDLAENLLVNIDSLVASLAQIVLCVIDGVSNKLGNILTKEHKKLITSYCKNISSENKKQATNIAKLLLESSNPMILSGALAANHEHADIILNLQKILLNLLSAKGGCLTFGANALGASLAGVVPYAGIIGEDISKDIKKGLNTRQMLSDAKNKIFILFNTDPVWDSALGESVLESLNQATVIAITPFVTEQMKKYADVILPMDTIFESSGTYVNAAGDWQSFQACTKSPNDNSRPGWKVLRVLANFLQVDDFDYKSVQQVKQELELLLAKSSSKNINKNSPDDFSIKLRELSDSDLELLRDSKPDFKTKFKPVYVMSTYGQDAIVRRSKPLQNTNVNKTQLCARVSKFCAEKLKLKAGDKVIFTLDADLAQQKISNKITLPVIIDNTLPDYNIVMPTGLAQTNCWADIDGKLSLEVGV